MKTANLIAFLFVFSGVVFNLIVVLTNLPKPLWFNATALAACGIAVGTSAMLIARPLRTRPYEGFTPREERGDAPIDPPMEETL